MDALTLQESDIVGQDQHDGRGGVTSAALWNCLRTVCVQMEQMELAAMCESQDLDGTFIQRLSHLSSIDPVCFVGLRQHFRS